MSLKLKAEAFSFIFASYVLLVVGCQDDIYDIVSALVQNSHMKDISTLAALTYNWYTLGQI